MESLVFLVLAPLALVLTACVGVVAWRRRSVAGGWALVAFSASSAGWLACDALSVAAATPEATLWLARAAVAWCPFPGVAWLAFLLSSTGQMTRPVRLAVVGLTVWSAVYGAMALTNPVHDLVWSTTRTVADGPFLGTSYTLGPLAWAQTLFMWSAVGGSMIAMLAAYARRGDRARTLSRWIVAGAFVPLAVSVVHLVGFGPVEKDFTPLAMAVSSGAFGLALARYRLLDLQPIARAALVDNLAEGVLVLDAHGYIADANPAARAALGAAAVQPGVSLRDAAPALADAVETETPDAFCLGAGPSARFVEVRVSALTDDSGVFTGRLVLLHDVTRRRGERAELHRANAELYHANRELRARNDELDAFAHTVAHDLKNSIHGVVGWADVLRDEGRELPPADFDDLAGSVVRAGHKMSTIVDELLLLAGVRQAAVELRPVPMAEVVEEALRRVGQTYALNVASPSAWPTAVGHAPWIEEVWVNYLTNAAKYGGSTVTLGADTTAAGHARFWVHDDGPGLAPEAQRALFVPFSRVGEQEAEGHGLGLSIVRRIAERLDGTCGVESAPGTGTRFWFALPLAVAAVARTAPDETVLRPQVSVSPAA